MPACQLEALAAHQQGATSSFPPLSCCCQASQPYPRHPQLIGAISSDQLCVQVCL